MHAHRCVCRRWHLCVCSSVCFFFLVTYPFPQINQFIQTYTPAQQHTYHTYIGLLFSFNSRCSYPLEFIFNVCHTMWMGARVLWRQIFFFPFKFLLFVLFFLTLLLNDLKVSSFFSQSSISFLLIFFPLCNPLFLCFRTPSPSSPLYALLNCWTLYVE